MASTKKAEVEIDRRANEERRSGSERRQKSKPVAQERRQTERRKAPRRRQIDPTTCERDYTNEEIEFMQALDAYKRAAGRMFPTCSEILEVIRDMGYVRMPLDGSAVDQPGEAEADLSTQTDAEHAVGAEEADGEVTDEDDLIVAELADDGGR